MNKAIVLDTETTGLTRPQVIELAYQILDQDLTEIENGFYCQRFKPSKSIEAGALKTHGISEASLKDMPASKDIIKHAPSIMSAQYIIGHHIDYDINAINETLSTTHVFKTICTKRLALEVLERQPSYSLVPLCKNLKLVDLKTIDKAHSAEADVQMTVSLLRHIAFTLKAKTGKPYVLDDLFTLYQSLSKKSYEDYKQLR